MELRIVKLDASTDLTTFLCEDPVYTKFLRNDALSYQQSNFSAIYLGYSKNQIAGYIGLSFGHFDFKKDGPGHTLPTLHIGKLACDVNFRGLGIGSKLVDFAFEKAFLLSNEVGLYAVNLKVDKERIDLLTDYYQKLGFSKIVNEANRDMFIKVETIKVLLSKKP